MQSTIRIPYRPAPRIERSPFDLVAIFMGLLLVTLLISVLAWQFWHTNRIYSGISIAGLPVGGMTRASALGQLNQRMIDYPLPPVTVAYNGSQWPLTADQVKAQVDWMAAVNQAYLVGRQGSFGDHLANQLVAALRGHVIKPELTYDVANLRFAIDEIAGEMRRPGRAASQIGSVSVPSQPGLDVDVEATLQSVLQALQNATADQIVIAPLAVIETPAPDAIDLAAPTAALPITQSTQPFLLRDNTFGLEFALDPTTLSRILVTRTPLRIDEDRLRALLGEWAAQVAIEPRDARLRFDPTTGGVIVLQASQNGRRLDIDATVANMRAALGGGQTQAALVVVDVPAAVDSNRVAEMGIRELVASGTTYFAGSSAERVHNIKEGASKLDGVVIPPGEIFSFNRFVEDVTSANGFADSLVIMGKQTLFGAGGGICQVSTTIFRAAYAAGLPIVERYNHGYVVDWYGEPGLDATIFTPVVDFRFRNDTGAYLLVEPVVDPTGVITFNLYGTKPNRVVTIGAPVQSEITQAAPPEYRVNEELAKDQRKQVEWEHNGMTVVVTRTIVEDGVARTDTLASKYEPWQAVYEVGPGTEIPTAVPSETVAPTAEISATFAFTTTAP